MYDFVNEAVKRNDIRVNGALCMTGNYFLQLYFLQPEAASVINVPKDELHLEVKKYERPSTVYHEQIPTAMNQENALRNWQKKMAERKRQQGYISSWFLL